MTKLKHEYAPGLLAASAGWTVQDFVDAVEAWRRRRLGAGPGLGWQEYAPGLLWSLASELPADVVGALALPVFDWAEEPMRRLKRCQWRDLFEIGGYRELDDERVRSGVLATPGERPIEPVRLYRGATHKGRRGMSWTTSARVAEIFAEASAALTREPASILTALVPPRQLLGRRVGMEFGADEYVVDTRGLEIEHVRASTGRLVRCRCGEAHWGARGAAGLLLTHTSRKGRTRVLLQYRDPTSQHGGTWGLPGGALEPDEDPLTCALRETREEVGIDATHATVHAQHVDDHGTWRYTTVIATTTRRETPDPNPAESIAARWAPIDTVPTMRLHPALKAAWPALRQHMKENAA